MGQRGKKSIAAKKRIKSSRTFNKPSFSGFHRDSPLRPPSLADQRPWSRRSTQIEVSAFRPFDLLFQKVSTPLLFTSSYLTAPTPKENGDNQITCIFLRDKGHRTVCC